MKKIPFFFGLLCMAVLCIGTFGCNQAINLIEKDTLVYQLELTKDGLSEGEFLTELSRSVFLDGRSGAVDSVEITVVNKGTEILEDLVIKKRGANSGNFSISPPSAGTLAPEESAVFTIAFLGSAQKGGSEAELLVGNDDANRILTLNYTAYDLVEDTDMTFSPPVLQMEDAGPHTVTTTSPDKGDSFLISSDPTVVRIEPDGSTLTAAGTGKAVIYFYTGSSETDYSVKGRAITVYPAVETLNPSYPLTELEAGKTVLGARLGETTLPINIDVIESAAGEEGRITFTQTGGTDVVSAIDEETGALSFTGEIGDEDEVQIDLTITRPVNEGTLQTYAGSALLTVRILPGLPGPEIQSAAINGADRNDAKKLVVTYDKPPVLDSLAGFSIVNSVIALNFAEYSVTDSVLTITLAREPSWPEITADNLKLELAYASSTGNVRDQSGNRGVDGQKPISLTGFSSELYQPPVVVDARGVVLDGNAQTSLVITWNKNLDPDSGYAGFTLQGAPGLIFYARTVAASVLTLTMSRAPAPSETANLTLSYNPENSSPVKDAGGNAAEAFSGKAVTVDNGGLFVNPPAVTGAVINAAAPASLVLTFDGPVAASSAAGFSITGSQTATIIASGVTGSGTAGLTFTLNRKPAYGETLTLSYNAVTGNVKHNANPAVALASFSGQAVSLSGFTQANDSRPVIQSIVVDANKDGTGANAEQAKKIYITYDKPVAVINANGFSVSGSSTAERITGVTGSGTVELALTLNDWPSESEDGAFKLAYTMDLGNVCDYANNDNLALSFAATAVTFRNYTGIGEKPDTITPRLVSATVENASPGTIRVEFHEPVTLDADKFAVKVNDIPFASLASAAPTSKIMLDIQNRTDRTMSAPVKVDAEGRIWDLTMNAPAVHGEILRLTTAAIPTNSQATPQTGAAVDTTGNQLPGIPEFIVSNKVKRVRAAYETQAGLYVNGSQITTVTDGAGGELYKNAMAYLHTEGNYPSANKVITLVLDTNQTISSTPSWWGADKIPVSVLTGGGCDVIITTPTGNSNDITITNDTTGAAFQGRNGIRLIIDEHIIFQQAAGKVSANSLVQMMDGGSVILDGGEIRNNVNEKTGSSGTEAFDVIGGGMRLGGGSYGSYFIMTGGKITGNTARPAGDTGTALNGSAGGIVFIQYGVFVMSGGEISNNTIDANGHAKTALAGGVMANIGTNQRHANVSFFMTGGEISGNTVTGSPNGTVASAGGVLVSGAFQKNGGTIYGADAGDASKRNTTTLGGSGNKVSAVFVAGTASQNPSTGAPSRIRQYTAGPDITLFVASEKAGTGVAGVNTVPAWATSYWDAVE